MYMITASSRRGPRRSECPRRARPTWQSSRRTPFAVSGGPFIGSTADDGRGQRLAFGPKNGTVFGLRARDNGVNAARRAKGLSVQQTDSQGFAADFACEFTDGARVTAVKETSVVLRSTDVSGLTVDVGCDGSVRMRHVGVGPGAPSVVSEEKERVVCGGGVVVRRLRDGSAQLLFADGSVARQDSDSTSSDDLEWTLLKAPASRTPRRAPGSG